MLDVYEMCAPELQEKMVTVRSKFKDMEDRKLEKQQQKVRFHPFNYPLCVCVVTSYHSPHFYSADQ